MALTELAVKRAKAQEKQYRLGDGDGLWMCIYPSGSKFWRLRYKYLGKETMLYLGSYPEITLSVARSKAIDAKRLIQQGTNPTIQRKLQKQVAKFQSENTFRAVAAEWFKNKKSVWTEDHGQRLWRRLELHILPRIGSRPIAEVTALELLDALRRPEEEDKTETTHRALQTCRAIFSYGVLTQRLKYNPALDLVGALKAHKETHYPTIGHNQLPEFWEKLNAARISDLTRLAVKLLMLTFVRQGEMRQAHWSDFDFKANEWRVRAETTKMRTLHHVPLSPQAIDVLKQIKKISGESLHVFPSQQMRRNPFMSENTINRVLHDLGYKNALVAHGFRSLASTVLNERGFRVDVIERQLAHMPRDRVRAAYNRAEYLTERRQMMEWWGIFVDGLGLNEGRHKKTPK